MSQPDDDDQDDAPVQRLVSAKDASPLYSPAASSVFTSWRKPGDALPAADEDPGDASEPAAAAAASPSPQRKEQEEPMAQRNGAVRARKSTRGSPQLQICSALLQNDLSQEDLRAALPGLTRSQIYSAVHNATSHKRMKFKESEQVYSLTAAGRTWAEAAGAGEAAAEPEPTKRTAIARKSATHRRGKSPRKASPPAAEVDTSPTHTAPRSFRCAVFSDGGFLLAKGDQHIELDAGEHAEMLAYLERMAEQETA